MTWFKGQIGSIMTMLAFFGALAAGWGTLHARQADLRAEIRTKADREPIVRELDQIQGHLARIEAKLDELTPD